MTKTLDLKGVIPPMISPLTTGGEVDEAAIDRLVEHMLSAGCTGAFVLGTSGEGPWLTPAQQRQVIGRTVKAMNGRGVVLAGALEPNAQRTIEALPAIADLGADAVVIASPYYFGADAAAQLQHFERVAAASPLPVMLYNIPPMTHTVVSVDTVREALQFDNIIGIKDSAGDKAAFEGFLNLRKIKTSFRVFQGAEKLAAWSMLAGADGLVPGLGNVAPRLAVQIYEAGKAGRESEALALQAQFDELGTLHNHDYWLVCLKHAASLLGFGSGATTGHPVRLTEEGRTTIRNLVTAATAPVEDKLT